MAFYHRNTTCKCEEIVSRVTCFLILIPPLSTGYCTHISINDDETN